MVTTFADHTLVKAGGDLKNGDEPQALQIALGGIFGRMVEWIRRAYGP